MKTPPIRVLCPLFCLMALWANGCTSKVSETVDEDRRLKLEAIQQCLPGQLEKLLLLMEFASLWRLNQGSLPGDPPGLTWVQQSGGELAYSISLSGISLSGSIRFYSPNGVSQTLVLPTSSLSTAIDSAATQLRALFPVGFPFLVATWTMSGAGASGAGALTGILGGGSGGNALLEIRTTEDQPTAGGAPPLEPGLITTSGMHACSLGFLAPDLRTDDLPGRSYPRGRIEFDLDGPDASVAAVLILDGSAIARIVVQGLRGFLTVNMDTLEIGAGR